MALRPLRRAVGWLRHRYSPRIKAAIVAHYPWPAVNLPPATYLRELGRPPRVLVVRPAPLGDTLILLGILRSLSEQYPGTKVHLIGGSALTELCEGLPYVGTVTPINGQRRWWSHATTVLWKRPRYDAVVEVFPITEHFNLALPLVIAAARAPFRLGPAEAAHSSAFTHRIPARADTEHMVSYLARCFLPLFPPGQEFDPAPRLAITSSERIAADASWRRVSGDGIRVLVNVAAGHRARRWPIDRYIAVVEHLRLRRPAAKVIVIGAGEEERARAVASATRSESVQTTIREMVALAATADLVITPDTSVGHVAAAFDRPVVSLHSNDKMHWRPYSAVAWPVYGPRPLDLFSLEARTVIETVDRVLSSPGHESLHQSRD